ncbi:MAG: hypothetical protein AAF525_07430 [Pseudomonadota bacterium]
MSWLEITALLGNLGEFVGALAVVATLIYLAIQVRYAKASLDANTAALEEDRRLALVQTYQTRALAAVDNAVYMSEPAMISVLDKIRDDGVDGLSQDEVRRFTTFAMTQIMRLDAIHFAWERGFIDEDFYENTFKALVVLNNESFLIAGGPIWRRSFLRDVVAILKEAFPEQEHLLGVRRRESNWTFEPTDDLYRNWDPEAAGRFFVSSRPDNV